MRPVVSLLLALVLGCTASASKVAPPRYDPYFPAALAISPDERYLFVLNANADLRFDSGTLQVIDLEQVDAILAGWTQGENVPPGCSVDPSNPKVLECDGQLGGQPQPWMLPDGTVKTGSFGVSLGVQALLSGKLRLFATVRGDPSVTWATFDPGAQRLSCGGSSEFHRCADANRLDTFRDDKDLGVLQVEPFYLGVDGPNEHVFVTHLTTGFITLVWAPLDEAQKPMLMDFVFGLFQQNFETGLVRAVGVAPRAPGDPGGPVYITSSSEARVATVHVASGGVDEQGRPRDRLVPGDSFFYGPQAADMFPGDARGIVFSPDGNRAYVAARLPAQLLVYDTSLAPDGRPRNQLVGTVEMCNQAAQLAVADFGRGPHAYVPCFANGQVWVADTERLELVAAVETGRGPTGIVASPTRNRVYVSNYADDTITIIDTEPFSSTENFAPLRIGKKRTR